MLHEPVGGPLEEDNAIEYKSKLGVKMFLFYAVIYMGFVAINTIKPTLMEWHIGGINLAVIYGFGLIILAIIMALIYNDLCTKEEARVNIKPEVKEEQVSQKEEVEPEVETKEDVIVIKKSVIGMLLGIVTLVGTIFITIIYQIFKSNRSQK